MRKLTPKFGKPHKPWDRARMENERRVAGAFGLRRKQEIWKAESILRTFRRTARELEAKKDKAKEEMFLNRLRKFGLVSPGARLDDVLALGINDILNRRLQTIVHRKGLASTLKQSRQYIVHGHIALDGRKAKWPSIIVDVEKEKAIGFREGSAIKPEKIARSKETVAKEKSEKAESGNTEKKKEEMEAIVEK